MKKKITDNRITLTKADKRKTVHQNDYNNKI
jgi:histone H3/H4